MGLIIIIFGFLGILLISVLIAYTFTKRNVVSESKKIYSSISSYIISFLVLSVLAGFFIYNSLSGWFNVLILVPIGIVSLLTFGIGLSVVSGFKSQSSNQKSLSDQEISYAASGLKKLSKVIGTSLLFLVLIISIIIGILFLRT